MIIRDGTVSLWLDCYADAVFKPKSRKDFVSTYEISALINYTEIHGPEDFVDEFTDSFRVTLLGTGTRAKNISETSVSPVPLPASAWGLFTAMGLLGWFARRRKARA